MAVLGRQATPPFLLLGRTTVFDSFQAVAALTIALSKQGARVERFGLPPSGTQLGLGPSAAG